MRCPLTCFCAAFVVVLGLFSGVAGAQEVLIEPSSRTRFYDFGELELTGARVKPKVLYTDSKRRAVFDRMFALKRSFLPELRRSADGASAVAPGGSTR
jgi:hypothetical protein